MLVYKLINHQKERGLIIWLTGLPCSGKTTLLKGLEKHFIDRKLPVKILDGDIFRRTAGDKVGFSKKDREENIKKAAQISKMHAINGINVIAAFVSPYRKTREFIRENCPNFIEVYVKCEISECIKRDVKGMYKKALAGEIKCFTGISDPFEKPENPEIIIETGSYSFDESLEYFFKFFN